MTLKGTILILFSLFFFNCTRTTIKEKIPILKNVDQTERELLALVKAGNINLNGKEIISGKNISSELEVSIINGQNIPTKDKERKTLARLIASCVKRNLLHLDEYDKYSIIFLRKTVSEGVISQTWVKETFSSGEL
jgi:protein involved in ribonucleotide reduction